MSMRWKFNKEHVGQSFDIVGITEYNGGRYGKHYLLATEDAVYYLLITIVQEHYRINYNGWKIRMW